MTTIKLRRGTAAQWTSADSVLGTGEPGVETDTGKFKIGDGSTSWSALPYATDTSRLPGSVGNVVSWANVITASGDTSGASDTVALRSAVAGLPTIALTNGSTTATYHYGTVRLGPGRFYFGTNGGSAGDLGNLGPFISLVGNGKVSTIVYYLGTGGTCFYLHNAVHPSDNTFDAMFQQAAPLGLAGRIDGMTIDGSNAGANSAGLWLADLNEGAVLGDDLTIQNFSAGGSRGLDFSCTVGWTENITGKVNLWNNTTAAYFGFGSHAYCDLRFKIYAYANQDAVVWNKGSGSSSDYYRGALRITGNFGYGVSSNSGAILRLGSGCVITNSELQIRAESNIVIGAAGGSVPHQTINFADSTSFIYGCQGIVDYYGQQSNIASTGSLFGFDGYVWGDTALNPRVFAQIQPSGSNSNLTVYAPPTSTTTRTVPQGKWTEANDVFSLDMSSGDTFDIGTISTSSSIQFVNVISGPRSIRIRAQSNGNALVNIAWPSNGSPSVINPNVEWENQIPPMLTRLNQQSLGTADWFDLWTIDGAKWIGRQRYNVGNAVLPVLTMGANWAGNSAASSLTQTLTAPGAQGNTMIAVIGNNTAGSTATPTVTDSKGNSWTVDAHIGSTGAQLWVAHAYEATALTTSDHVTVTWSASTSGMFAVWEVSGLGSSPALDQFQGTDLGTTNAASISIVCPQTQKPGEFALTAATIVDQSSSVSSYTLGGSSGAPSGPWSQDGTTSPAGYIKIGHMVVPAPGAQLESVWGFSPNQEMVACIATYG